jgi:hypothetical protein
VFYVSDELIAPMLISWSRFVTVGLPHLSCRHTNENN